MVRGCPARHRQTKSRVQPLAPRFKILGIKCESGVPLNTEATPAHFPAAAYEQQDIQFQAAFDVVRRAIDQRVFPAAALAVTLHGRLVALKAFGRFTYQADSPEVAAASIFDLASLTKVVSTTTIAMIL